MNQNNNLEEKNKLLEELKGYLEEAKALQEEQNQILGDFIKKAKEIEMKEKN